MQEIIPESESHFLEVVEDVKKSFATIAIENILTNQAFLLI